MPHPHPRPRRTAGRRPTSSRSSSASKSARASAPDIPANSRSRLLAAAIDEFAARGFAGAGVDRIARRARLNKAMIYYHFKNKTALYREVLRDMFRASGERVSAIARSSDHPEAKVRAFIEAMVTEAASRPHFPSMMLRELADDGRHLDPQTIALLQVMPRTLMAILEEGVAQGRFQPVNPLFAYMTMIGPLIFYFASAPVRSRIAREGLAGFDGSELQPFVAHVQGAMLTLLRPQGDGPAAQARRPQ